MRSSFGGRSRAGFVPREQSSDRGGQVTFNRPAIDSAAQTQQQAKQDDTWAPQLGFSGTSGGGVSQRPETSTSLPQAARGGGATFNQPTISSAAPTQQQAKQDDTWAPQRGSSFGQRGQDGGATFNRPAMDSAAPTQQQAKQDDTWAPQLGFSGTSGGGGGVSQRPEASTSLPQAARGGGATFNQPTSSSAAPTQQQAKQDDTWAPQVSFSGTGGGNLHQRGSSFGQRGQDGGATFNQPTISGAAPTQQQAKQDDSWAPQLNFSGTGGGGGRVSQRPEASTSLPQAARGAGGGRGGGGYFGENRPNGHETTAAPQQQPAWGGGAAFGVSSSDGNFQTSAGGANTQPARPRPTNMPLVRSVEQLYLEDKKQAAFSNRIAEEDAEVVVTGAAGPVVKIDKWEELAPNLDAKILENIGKCSYSRPRKIQAFAIPLIMEGYDLKGQSETGSGKTAAFLLPIIDKIMKMDRKSSVPLEKPSPIAVIIEPTRELCLQVYEQAQKLANGTGVLVAKTYGGYNMTFNLRELNAGCDILCATPSRLQHLYFSKLISMDKLKFFVLDEADSLLDGGFLDVVRSLCNDPGFPPSDTRQTILFSATFPDYIEKLSDQMLRPERVTVSNKSMVAANTRVRQDFVPVESADKKDKVLELLKGYFGKARSEAPQEGGDVWSQPRVLVFVKFKRDADMLAIYLSENDIPSVTINSDRPQVLRERALKEIRDNKASVLVATDVMARGMDIQHLDHVINYDLPEDSITYVHRIGRTGRMGPGLATSFFDEYSTDAGQASDLVKVVRDAGQEPAECLLRCAEGVPTMKADDAQLPNASAAAGGGW